MRFPEEGCVQKVAKVRQLTKINGKTTIFRSNQDTRLMLKSTLIAGQGSSMSKNLCLFWRTQLSALLLSFLREKNNQITNLNQNYDFSILILNPVLLSCSYFYNQILRVWVLVFFDPK